MLTKQCNEVRIGSMRRKLAKGQSREDTSPWVEIDLAHPGAVGG